MLYKFCDTNEQPFYVSLPAEALSYNGKYIDEEIPLFRTLYVSGRESFSADISETVLESLDGSVFLRRRLLPRTITVGYQISAGSAQELMEAYNHLNHLMRPAQVKVSFADEPDKYYIGTCKSVGVPEPGRLTVKGEIEIYCTDPCKYAKDTVTIQPESDGIFTFEYGGTVPAYPVFTASFAGDAKQVVLTGNLAVVSAGDADSEQNVFSSGDTINIDCGAGKIYLNDVDAPFLGDIANQFEQMTLEFGTNTITTSYTGTAPVFTMTYREAWL